MSRQYVTDTLLTSPYMDQKRTFITVGPTDLQLVPADSSRVAIAFCLNGIGAFIGVLPGTSIAIDTGLIVEGNKGPLILTYASHGLWVISEWHGIASGAGGILTVLELTYKPPRTVYEHVGRGVEPHGQNE